MWNANGMWACTTSSPIARRAGERAEDQAQRDGDESFLHEDRFVVCPQSIET
jgi:hypothetical protein